MKTMSKLMVAAAATVAALSGGAVWANDEGDRRGPNAVPGSVSASFSPQELAALFCEMAQGSPEAAAGAGSERRAPAARGASRPPQARSADSGGDASRQGPNIVGEAASTGGYPVAPDRPAAGRQGGGAGNPAVTRQCPRCLEI